MASVKLSSLISRLRDEGVIQVEIRYDGSGDSGSVEDIELVTGNHDRENQKRLDDMFDEELRDFAYHVLEHHYDWDWYNNEGGYGSVDINVETSEISINGYVREVVDASTSVDVDQIEY